MNHNFSILGKEVRINGQPVITNWRKSKVVAPGNLQERMKSKDAAKQEILEQKKFVPKSNNAL